jgi:hypothetical protein
VNEAERPVGLRCGPPLGGKMGGVEVRSSTRPGYSTRSGCNDSDSPKGADGFRLHGDDGFGRADDARALLWVSWTVKGPG